MAHGRKATTPRAPSPLRSNISRETAAGIVEKMTVWQYIHVRYSERKIAAQLGAVNFKCEGGRWGTFCTTTQFKSKAFKRWHDPASLRRIDVFPDRSEVEVAKAHGLIWDRKNFKWVLETTADNPAAEMDDWIRARLEPARSTVFNIPYSLKLLANRHKLKWNSANKKWSGTFRAGIPKELQNFIYTESE